MKSDRELLEEINNKLTKICNYIDKIESEEYKLQDYIIQFLLNVAADMYVELLEKLRNGRETSDNRPTM